MGQRADAISERDRKPLDSTESASAGGSTPDAEIATIRDEIEQTRDEMSRTLNALEAKLNPEHLVAQAKDSVRNEAQARVAQARHAALDLLSDLRADLETARQELPGWARGVREQAPGQVRAQARAALIRVRRWREENPQAFKVAAGMAGGSLALVGLVVALTQRRARRTRAALAAENARANVLGLRDATRDRLVDHLESGMDTARRVRRVARTGRRAMRTEAAQQGLLVGE